MENKEYGELPNFDDGNVEGALPAYHTDNAPLGYTAHEKSAWSVGYEECLCASHGPAPAAAPELEQKLDDLLELIDTYAETRHTCGCKEYNVKTLKAYEAVCQALEGR
jgi:hypothetical protein